MLRRHGRTQEMIDEAIGIDQSTVLHHFLNIYLLYSGMISSQGEMMMVRHNKAVELIAQAREEGWTEPRVVENVDDGTYQPTVMVSQTAVMDNTFSKSKSWAWVDEYQCLMCFPPKDKRSYPWLR